MSMVPLKFILRRIGRTRFGEHEVYERHEACEIAGLTEKSVTIRRLDADGNAGQEYTVRRRDTDRFFSEKVKVMAAANTLNHSQRVLAEEVKTLLKQNRATKQQYIKELGGIESP